LKAMRSFSENAPIPVTMVNDPAREYAFLCTEVVVCTTMTQPFIRTKNDIGSDGTLS
jgi:hypothetical protein